MSKLDDMFVKVETHALSVLESFQEHPIKTIIMAVVILWFLKYLVKWMREI